MANTVLQQLLPFYIRRDLSWDIHDYNKAMNVCVDWAATLRDNRFNLARFKLPMVNYRRVAYDQMKVVILIHAFSKNEMDVRDMYNVIESGELFIAHGFTKSKFERTVELLLRIFANISMYESDYIKGKRMRSVGLLIVMSFISKYMSLVTWDKTEARDFKAATVENALMNAARMPTVDGLTKQESRYIAKKLAQYASYIKHIRIR